MLSKDQLNMLFRYAIALANDEARAYDLVHSSLEKVWKKRTNAPNSYYRAAIRNMFLDEQKRENRFYHEKLDENLEHPVLISERGLEDIYIEKESAHEILSQLSPFDREILYLFAVEGMTFDEISKETGKKKGTLLSRIHRIREKFKNYREVKSGIIS